MPILSNPKYEKYCQAMISEDGSPKKVMDAAGYKFNASYFSQLKRKPKIAARIQELQKSVISEKVLNLQQRLEMLSDIARDTTVLKSIRIKALHELHNQSGDAIDKVELSGSTENVIKYVQIKLPEIIKDEPPEEKLDDAALEGLDKFLDELEVIDK